MLIHGCLALWVADQKVSIFLQHRRPSTVDGRSPMPCAGWACKTLLARRPHRGPVTRLAPWNIESSFQIRQQPASSELFRRPMGVGGLSASDYPGEVI